MGGGSLRLGLDLLLFRWEREAWVVVLGVSGLGNVLGMVGCHSVYGVISNNQAMASLVPWFIARQGWRVRPPHLLSYE
jgi:hypothetical protein